MIYQNGKYNLITEGGEGFIYDYGNSVIKIYKPHIDLAKKQQKVQQLLNEKLPANVVAPTELVYDSSRRFIGYVMQKIDHECFKMLANKRYVKTQNITTKDVLMLLDDLWKTITHLHNRRIYIGDLNDQNVLFDLTAKRSYLIDVDSWSIGSVPCEVAMDLFKDPNIKGDNFNAETDTYAFCVIAWKSLTRIHPFGGTTSPDMNIMDRIARGLSVIDNPNVTIPKIAKHWRNLSPDMVAAFKSVFNNGVRTFDGQVEDMLNNLAFCKNDNDYYYSKFNKCPMCDHNAIVIKQAVAIGIANGFHIIPLVNPTDVKVAYDQYTYLNNSGEVVDIRSGCRIPFNGDKYLFLRDGHVVVCKSDKFEINISGAITSISIRPNTYVQVEDEYIYYISNTGHFTQAKIVGNGLYRHVVGACSGNAYFAVCNGHKCTINHYMDMMVITIDGYYYNMDCAGQINDVAAHYDAVTNDWLIVIEDANGERIMYALNNNVLKWSSNQIRYQGDIYNICFSNGIIYMPIDDAIRGMNYRTMRYKDFTCNIVNGDSRLIKQGKQFIIVNTDSIYRFYK